MRVLSLMVTFSRGPYVLDNFTVLWKLSTFSFPLSCMRVFKYLSISLFPSAIWRSNRLYGSPALLHNISFKNRTLMSVPDRFTLILMSVVSTSWLF